MAYRIKKQKVNRKFLYNCIQAQQKQINVMFEERNTANSMRLYLEKRLKELMRQVDDLDPYQVVSSHGAVPVIGGPGGIPPVLS
jgi:hypothetical protein